MGFRGDASEAFAPVRRHAIVQFPKGFVTFEATHLANHFGYYCIYSMIISVPKYIATAASYSTSPISRGRDSRTMRLSAISFRRARFKISGWCEKKGTNMASQAARYLQYAHYYFFIRGGCD